MRLPFVSILLVVRNGKDYLQDCIDSLIYQDYPREKMEFLFIDGCSEDGTYALLEQKVAELKQQDYQARIFVNEKKILASGWNLGIREAHGDYVCRIDAHSRIPQNFVRKNVACIAKGEKIVGGMRITEFPKDKSSYLLFLAEKSKFGSGIANYRHKQKAGYVDTIAHAVYSREVFIKVGGYNECLIRNQDMEIHYRMKKAGFKFFYDPTIKSYHLARNKFSELLKQKYGNGKWIALTLMFQPKCFAVRHYVPFIFTFSLIMSLLIGLLGNWMFLKLLSSAYLVGAFIFTFKALLDKNSKGVRLFCFLLPIIFLSMHLTYGLGTIVGFMQMPFFVWKNKGYKIPFSIKS
ncbi:MAG: glycosyltransferase family 2 protein [Phycisphaerae bacterium]|jgi:glycosyltransferase involved in cell wall biosynthesis